MAQQMSIQFRVKYWTTWGQNLVVCGSDPRLGGWDVRKGVWMHCQHVGDDELLWIGSVRGEFSGSFDYRYAVVDGDMNVVRWDSLTHTADFPPLLTNGNGVGVAAGNGGGGGGGAGGGRRLSTVESVGNGSGEENGGSGGGASSSSKASSSSVGFGDKVEIQDTWEFQSHPENLFLRTAFRDVVIPPPKAAAAGPGPGPGGGGGPNAASPPPQPHHSPSNSPARVGRASKSADALALEAAGGGASASALHASSSSAAGMLRLRLEVRTLRLLPGQRLHVTGSGAAVGCWDRDRAAPMVLDKESRTWRLDVNVAPDELPLHYKYALKGGPANDALESGMDRVAAPMGWGDADRPFASPSDGDLGDGGGSGGDGGGGGGVGGGGGGGVSGSRGGGGLEETTMTTTTTGGMRPVSAGSDGGIAVDLAGVTLTEEGGGSTHGFPPSPPSPPRRPRLPSRIVVRDGHFRYPGVWRGSGLAVPVFSLRSCDSVGAGTTSTHSKTPTVKHA